MEPGRPAGAAQQHPNQTDDEIDSDNGYLQGEHRLRGSEFVPYENSILDIAGVRPGRLEDGISLLPARGEAPLPRRDVPLEALRPLFRFHTPITAFDVPYYGVRTERYKHVHWSFGDTELYDLRRDPDELENLAAKPAYAGLAKRLEAKAARLRHCRGAGCR